MKYITFLIIEVQHSLVRGCIAVCMLVRTYVYMYSH